MCLGLGGGGTKSTAGSDSRASAKVDFTPTISIGSNQTEPAQDTPSTFARALLSSPVTQVEIPSSSAPPASSTTKILAGLAVALAARRALKR